MFSKSRHSIAFEQENSRRGITAHLGQKGEMWECELLRQMKTNLDIKEFFDLQSIQEPLDPRAGFYGGRTNATKLYYKTAPGEKIGYVDVCSLYPFICKYGEFPVGHPEIITENFQPLDNRPYEGMITCKVLPPRQLLHAVLPYRSANKLTFPLCRTCTDERNMEPCRHTTEERAIWGTWVLHEVYKGLKLGYQILEIAEVWHYSTLAKRQPGQPDSGLFSSYIDTFLKLKQEKSDWPKWVPNSADVEQAKDNYIRQYEEKEGIKLDKTQIERNEALRQLAKLCLNSFWGKFGQRDNLGHAEYFDEPAEFFKWAFDPTTQLTGGVRFFGEKRAFITYKKEEEFIEPLKNVNAVIAAFVTCQARLKLYSYIEKLQERTLYFDTDSVIFLTRPTEHISTTNWRFPW